jgi:hypothetical protein
LNSSQQVAATIARSAPPVKDGQAVPGLTSWVIADNVCR